MKKIKKVIMAFSIIILVFVLNIKSGVKVTEIEKKSINDKKDTMEYCNDTILNTLIYKLNNDEIRIFFENNNKLEITFGYGGVNSLYGIQEISYSNLQNNELNKKDNSNTLKSCTDWIGPYMMKDLSKESKDISKKFTGGWHGSNGDGTGEVTAITNDVKIYCDGNLVTLADEERCKEIKIVVSNLVKAYNSTEPVLKEIITYVIKNEKVYVNVKGNALANIEIERYYGLQSQNSLWDGYVTYHYTDNSFEKFLINESSKSMKKQDKIVKEFELSSMDNKYKLVVGLDNNLGLGNFQSLSESLSTSFTTDYGKSYFNLINGKTMKMVTGDSFIWGGCYKILNAN